jgi:hypothetical protein
MRNRSYIRIYKKHYGNIPEGHEIHHKDGNHSNNHPKNLKAVTLQEHYDIHYTQGDWGAVQAILIRMKYDSKELSEAARKFQLEKFNNGTHNFQKITKERRSEISHLAALDTVKKKIGIHAINADPKKANENAKQAGLISKKKKAGFHNPSFSVSKYVKNTFWWVHKKTGKRKRSMVSPGQQWKKGMNNEYKSSSYNTTSN